MKPLGILGGGQLARMMALKAHEIGIPVKVLSERREDPAAQVTSLWVQGRLDNRETLTSFLRACSVATFESEFLDADLLEILSKETGTPIYPKPRHMAVLQDRLTQKRLLEKHGLPTSAFLEVHDEESARRAFAVLSHGGRKGEKAGGVVFKKRRFGYDGYGTFVVRSERELEKFLPELSGPALSRNKRSLHGFNDHGFIGERFVPFRRELAVMVARGRDGRTLRFPFVETLQENSRCLWVKGPLRESPRLERLGKKAEEFLTALGYVGVMGIELFDTGREILVNELAPRVHNSGHYSLDALTEDQFTVHLKSVLGCALAPPAELRLHAPGFAMMNLLGSSDHAPSWRLPSDVHLHWYGKSENRPGRKMGHINALDRTPAEALAKALNRRADFNV